MSAFSRALIKYIGRESGLRYAPPPLSTANLMRFFFNTRPAGTQSSYFNETNVVRKAVEVCIIVGPQITLAMQVESARNLDSRQCLVIYTQAMTDSGSS